MGPKQKKNASLASVLRGICLKPPQKFHPGLISDVYSRIDSAQNLQDLLRSGYFETVLWNFFHPDVSNSHLELLLEVASYEHDQMSQSTCLDLIRKEPTKASQLMLRLLVSTLTSTESNSKIEAKFYIFLRSVLVVCPDLLLNSYVYPKWRDSVMLRYSKSIIEQPESPNQFDVIQCFLLFCMSCIASKTDLSAKVSSLVIPTFFRFADNGLVRWLAELLLIMTVKSYKDPFSRLQISLKKTSTGANVPSAFLAPLEYDVHTESFIEELQMLPESTLETIASDVGYNGPKVSIEIMVQIIHSLSLGSRITNTYLQTLLESSEENLIDVFEKNNLVSHFPEPLIPYNYTEPIYDQMICKRTHESRKSIFNLAMSSLNRLEISDPSSAQGIKGSSKYFALLEKVISKGSAISITGLSDQFRSKIHNGDYVLLLELQKPNKFGGLVRVAKHGLLSCRIGKVTKNDQALEVYRSLPDLDDRFNAIISLASLPLASALTTNCSKLFKQLESSEIENVVRAKKEFTNDSLLNSMLSSSLTKLQGFPKLEAQSYTTKFLQQFEEELQLGLTVCVVPTKAAVDLYPLLPKWVNKTFKFDSFNESLTRAIARINTRLTEVSMLSDRLNLSEYDFDGSIRNALMLYECHVLPKWKAYASKFSEDNYDDYPFGEIIADTYEDFKAEAASHYFEICRIFSDLQELVYFDKFNLSNLKDDDIEKLNKDLIKRAKLIVVLYADIEKVPVGAESIISENPLYYPSVDDQLKRFIATGPTNLQIPQTIEYSTDISTFKRSQKDHVPGFLHSCQRVKVPLSDQQVNIEEATYCLSVYRYMKLTGYSHNQILIVCASPFTKLLLEEMNEEHSKSGTDTQLPIIQMATEIYPCDFAIVSTHGGLKTAQYFELLSSTRMGFVIVGAETAEPYEIFSGKLALLPKERYGDAVSRHDTILVEIKDTRQLGNLVNQLEKESLEN